MQVSLCLSSTAVDLSKHPVSSRSVHQALYYHVSLDLVSLAYTSNRPQQTPLINRWEKSHITDDAIWSWLAGPLFCQKKKKNKQEHHFLQQP